MNKQQQQEEEAEKEYKQIKMKTWPQYLNV